MSKKYIVIDHENSKYYKGVPYITKKEFNKNENNVIVGKTRLKENKSDSDNNELDLLCFNDTEYKVKDKLFGFKKGYIYVGDNNYIVLKRCIPFILLLLLLMLLIGLFLFFNFKDTKPNPKPINNTPENTIVPDNKDKKEDSKSSDKKKEDDPYKYVPKRDKVEEAQGIKYKISFDANGGEGTMDSITCDGNEVCKLPKSTLTREGYIFTGWSTEINGEPIYLDEMEVFNLSTENNANVVLYAMWHIESFDVEFLDYDGSTIQKVEYDYGDSIITPENPERSGYTFLKWDNDVKEVKEDLVINALYNINNYEISYDLSGGAFNEDAPSTYTIEDDSFSIPTPSKKGYTFLGWTNMEDNNPNIDYKIKQGTIGNIELIANYEPNSYNLIYNTNGAKEIINPKEIKFDEEYGKLPSVSKEGYNFINWTNEANKEVSSKTVFSEENDITINANWDTITYTITYNLIGGKIEDTPNSYNIETENIIIPNPEKEGYIFVGWSTQDDDTLIKDYEIPKGTIGNIELTANYKPISYYISYNSSGGEGTMDKTKIKYNNHGKLSKNLFTKEGYNFVGWSTSENGDLVYLDEQDIYNLSNSDNDVINLYAKWEIIKLSVKYYDLFGVILKEEIVDYGNNSIPPENPFIDGYTFTGWNPSNEPIKSDTVYQAKYNRNDYVIKYDLNTSSSDDIKEIKYNVESDAITLPTPTREGYTFLGWTGDNGLRLQLQVIIPKGTIGNKSYKANWEANIYKISLNPNKGTVIPDYVNISYNSLYGIIPEATRRGYSFEGWYYNNSLITEDSLMKISSNHELKADWKVIDYDITYNLNGGSLSSKVSKYNIETETFTLSNPTREGYTFLGWTGDNGTTPSTSVKIEKGSIGNKSYTANWQVINYSISYNLDGGSVSSQPTSYNIESSSFSLPQPTKKGYTFAGWTGTGLSSATKNVTINTGSIGNRSYTATWNKNYYTVNYYVNGNLWAQRSVGYSDGLPNLNGQDALDGYHKFHGWNGWVDSMPDHDVTLTASVTECYCRLTTGHGPIGNANGLLSVFQSAGWTGRVQEQTLYPGNYLVITDYTLTRAQAEAQKNYIAAHTNYTNYNFPYLYWVAIDCTNGYAEAWTRGLGQSQFN
ncbi:MAG: InlB B-repeat-containing protein [Bacilli bacterium]|nr:InlB B-repeat-containing protein [Bacilli bacterium]